jgi:hypothetical protein
MEQEARGVAVWPEETRRRAPTRIVRVFSSGSLLLGACVRELGWVRVLAGYLGLCVSWLAVHNFVFFYFPLL